MLHLPKPGSIAICLLLLAAASNISCSQVYSKESAVSDCPALPGTKPAVNTSVRAKIEIEAPPQIVWQSLQEYRKRDPERSSFTVISQTSECRVAEEQLSIPTIFGLANCRISIIEVPNLKITYKLIQGDRFRAMEGNWLLMPSQDRQSTTLVLSTHVEINAPIPRIIVNHIAHNQMQKKLIAVKRIATSMVATTLAEQPSK
jgi:hypothetical protein